MTRTTPIAAGQSATTSYGYDAAGNPTRITDGRLNTTVQTWTPWNTVATVTEPATAAHPAVTDRRWTYTYDAAGRLEREAEPGGVASTFSYDAGGDLLSIAGSGARGFVMGGRITDVRRARVEGGYFVARA